MSIQAVLQVDSKNAILGMNTVFHGVRGAVWKLMFAIRGSAQNMSPVDTGKFKKSWSMPRKNKDDAKGFGYWFENTTDYGDCLEYGLYPKVGKKTVSVAGGIYSRQAPGGIVNQILNDESYMKSAFDAALEGKAIPRKQAAPFSPSVSIYTQKSSMFEKKKGQYSTAGRYFRSKFVRAFSYRGIK